MKFDRHANLKYKYEKQTFDVEDNMQIPQEKGEKQKRILRIKYRRIQNLLK